MTSEWGGLDAIFTTKKPTPADPPTQQRPLTLAGETTAYGRRALTDNCAAIANPRNKTRNTTLNDYAFATYQLVEAGLIDRADADRELWAAARSTTTRGDHPFPDSEIANTLNSASAGAKAKPRRNLPDLTRPYDPTDWITGNPPPPATPPGSEELWDARPHLHDIRQWAQARRASPWAVLGCALARITTLIPPFHVLPPLAGGQASLNLFIGLVGPSGAGKGAAEAVAREMLDTAPITTAPLGSGEGIAHQYMRRLPPKEGGGTEMHTREVLFTLSEIDTLNALHGRQGSTVLAELRRAWMGEQLGFAYVDPAKRLPVDPHEYRFTLIAGIQPGRAAILLDDSDGGTPQRFTWLPATDPDAPDTPPETPPRITWEMPTHSIKGDSWGKREMGVCDEAATLIDQSRVARLRGEGHALDGHELLARLKIAAALAWLDNTGDVRDDDWRLAGHLMDVSNTTRATCVDTLTQTHRRANLGRAEGEAERQIIIAEKVDEAAAKRVARVITRAVRHAGPDGMSRSAARKAVASRDRGHFDDALNRLAEAGRVTIDNLLDGDRITLQEDE